MSAEHGLTAPASFAGQPLGPLRPGEAIAMLGSEDRWAMAAGVEPPEAAEAALRQLVALALGEKELREVVHASAGQPLISGRRNLSVSISRSQGKFAAAVASQLAIGIDIEAHVEIEREEMKQILRHTLGLTAPTPLTAAHFYRLWTLAEAGVKAEGDGLQSLRRPGSRTGMLLRKPTSVDWSAAWTWTYTDAFAALVAYRRADTPAGVATVGLTTVSDRPIDGAARWTV